MGVRRNGSSTFIKVLLIACRVSHLPGFLTGLQNIIGNENAETLMSLWTPICDLIEDMSAQDDYAFRKDYSSGGEPQDQPFGS